MASSPDAVEVGDRVADVLPDDRLVGVLVRRDQVGGGAAAAAAEQRCGAAGTRREHDRFDAVDREQRILDVDRALGDRVEVGARGELLRHREGVLSGAAEEVDLEQGGQSEREDQQEHRAVSVMTGCR